MAKAFLQNVSAWSHMKTIDEASKTVSTWPEWKRDRQLFSGDDQQENAEHVKKTRTAHQADESFLLDQCRVP